MKGLQESKQAQLVQTDKYQKSGRPRGRPSEKEKVAESNHKINQYFATQHRSNNINRNGGSSRGGLNITSINNSQ